MLRSVTYPHDKIGTLTRPTPEERAREGDRWVSLRALQTAPVSSHAAPIPAEKTHAPQTRALFRAVEARHAQARRNLENHPL